MDFNIYSTSKTSHSGLGRCTALSIEQPFTIYIYMQTKTPERKFTYMFPLGNALSIWNNITKEGVSCCVCGRCCCRSSAIFPCQNQEDVERHYLLFYITLLWKLWITIIGINTQETWYLYNLISNIAIKYTTLRMH